MLHYKVFHYMDKPLIISYWTVGSFHFKNNCSVEDLCMSTKLHNFLHKGFTKLAGFRWCVYKLSFTPTLTPWHSLFSFFKVNYLLFICRLFLFPSINNIQRGHDFSLCWSLLNPELRALSGTWQTFSISEANELYLKKITFGLFAASNATNFCIAGPQIS